MLNHNVAWRSTFFRAFFFARELVDRGHEVTLATISPTGRLSFAESARAQGKGADRGIFHR